MKIRTGIFGFLLGVVAFSAIICPTGVFGEDRLHTVQKGETFYSIARTLGIKADDLMRYNGITDPSRLQAGQRLRIPDSMQGSSSETGAAVSYRVVRGDTLYSIARRFSVTVEKIMEFNSLPANYMLREGDTLSIPSGSLGSVASSGTSGSPGPLAAVVPAAAPVLNQATPASAVSWPVTVRDLSYMTGKLSGVVITGIRSEPVSSLTRGTVLSAGPYRGFSQVVIIQVDGGYLYVYGGCESLMVKEGDRVAPGTELGRLGLDAVSNKPQLFFMVYRSNNPVDPAKAPRA